MAALPLPEPATPDQHDQAWRASALCAQVDVGELFYPERGQPTHEAKAVCAACPVRAECLQHAIDTGETYGIWGGTSPLERRKLRPTTVPCRRCGTTIPRSGSRAYCEACARIRRSGRPATQRPNGAIRLVALGHDSQGTGPAVTATGHVPLPVRAAPYAGTVKPTGHTWPAPKETPCPTTSQPASATPSAPSHPTPPAPARPQAARAVRPVKPKPTKPKPQRTRRPRATPPAALTTWTDLYAQGYTIPHIAATTGASPVTVRRHLQRAGIPMRDDRAGHSGGRNRRTWTPAQLAAAAQAYLDGARIADVARALRTGPRQARDALLAAGVPIRPPASVPRKASA